MVIERKTTHVQEAKGRKCFLENSVATVSNALGRIRKDAEKSGLGLQGGGCWSL